MSNKLMDEDPFEPYCNHKVSVVGHGFDKMVGLVTGLNNHFLVLTHKDGRTTTLRRNTINFISFVKVVS